MSCAQVMYQPYAPNPPYAQHQASSSSSTSSTSSTTSSTTSSSSSTTASSSSTPSSSTTSSSSPSSSSSSESRPLLHLPPPPHAHLHHAHHHHVGGDSGGGRRPLTLFRAASRDSPSGAADPDAPPPEKKFCVDGEAPTHHHHHHQPPPPPHHHHHHHQHHHQHHQHHHHHLPQQQQQHHHHHHHQHHQQHQPPSSSPPEQANQEVKYVSANCMVVTNYAGDVATVVDEHFSRALSSSNYKPHSPGKASSPMSSRNFPPSFWNSSYQAPSSSSSSSSSRPSSLTGHPLGASPADLYDPYHGGLHPLQPPAHDPWTAYSLSSQAYGHRSVAHDVYQAAMSSVPSTSRPYHHQYSSLSLQPHLARLPAVGTQMGMSKPEAWGARYHEAFANPDFGHGLEANYSSAPHYPSVPGLETGVPQEGAKDLYWF